MVPISDANIARSRHRIWPHMDGVHFLFKIVAGLLNIYSLCFKNNISLVFDFAVNGYSQSFYHIAVFGLFVMLLQAVSPQEESQRMTAVRKVFQRAIITPTHHVEQLWKDYENFENSVSRQLVMCWGVSCM